jgi:hypothetical protein
VSKLKEELISMFWEDIGPKIRKDDYQNTIYHYTSIDGLMGIIKDKQLRMTKSDFLNDSKEIKYINNVVEEALLKSQTLIEKNYGDQINQSLYYQLFFEQFNRTVKNRTRGKSPEVYVMSLSENKDSLTLWGNYASTEGYNIGFATSTLLKDFDKALNEFFIVSGNVIYDYERQVDLLSNSIFSSFELINLHQPDIDDLKKELYPYFNSMLISYSIFFKDTSFKHEEEFRIAATNTEKAKVNFRARNGVIIPFIEAQFENLPIQEIVIGPKNNSDIAENGVEVYLDRNSYETEKILITKSAVPLRY